LERERTPESLWISLTLFSVLQSMAAASSIRFLLTHCETFIPQAQLTARLSS
jgi:hypothetical protein